MDIIFGGLVFASLVAAYFLPAIVAARRGHRSATAISVLNLLLGWTFIGWVLALVWALAHDGKVRA